MARFENAKELFKWLASDELSKEDILNMLTEDMCAELIIKNNGPYLESNGDKYDYHYDGGVVGNFKAPKMDRDRMEILLYNAITYIEDQGISGWAWMPELGISDEEYRAVVGDGYGVVQENAVFTYDISFSYTVNNQPLTASILDPELNNNECIKPNTQCTANIIRSYLSSFYKGDELFEAVESIDNIELMVERNGEYYDRDEAEEETIKQIISLAKAPLLKDKIMKVLYAQPDGFIMPNQSDFFNDVVNGSGEFLAAIYEMIDEGILRRRNCEGLAYEFEPNFLREFQNNDVRGNKAYPSYVEKKPALNEQVKQAKIQTKQSECKKPSPSRDDLTL